MTHVKKLKYIRSTVLTLLLIATLFVALQNFYVAIPLAIITFLIEITFFRCPHCKRSLDTRITLNSTTYCPYCGKQIDEINKNIS